MILWLN